MSIDYYVITDGSRYITKNKTGAYVPECDISKALVMSKQDADRVYSNHLSRPLRKVFRLAKRTLPMIEAEEIKNGLLYEIDEGDGGKIQATNEKASLTDAVNEKNNHYEVDYDLNNEILEDAKKIVKIFKSAKIQKSNLESKLDKVEKEIVDIYHYIEFHALNACDGYAAYKMLRNRLINRRKYKNELKIMEILTKGIFTTSDILEIEKIMISFGKNKYSPRVLKELFEK